jgi:hypothetical protein
MGMVSFDKSGPLHLMMYLHYSNVLYVTSITQIVLFPLFGLGVSHASCSTVYIWTFEALTIGSLAIYSLSWLLQKRRGS